MLDEENLNDSELDEPTEELDVEPTVEVEGSDTDDADDSEEELHEITVNGEVEQKTLEELKSGYQKNADYTQGKQEVAQDKKAYGAAKDGLDGLGAQLQTQINELEAQLKVSQGTVDWEVDDDGMPLYDDDMPKHQRHQAKLTKARKVIEKAQSEQDKTNQDALKQEAQIENGLLLKAIPEWKTAKNRKQSLDAITKYAQSIGFTTELNDIIDHRMYKVFHDAARFSEGKSDAELTEDADKKKVRKAPKSSKPKKVNKNQPKSFAEKLYGSG